MGLGAGHAGRDLVAVGIFGPCWVVLVGWFSGLRVGMLARCSRAGWNSEYLGCWRVDIIYSFSPGFRHWVRW